MPFKSRAQASACFAKRTGPAKGWNCEEWAHATTEHQEAAARRRSVGLELEKQATTMSQLLGVRAAALYLGV